MDAPPTIDDCLRDDAVQRDIADAARALVAALGAAPEQGAVRRLVRTGLAIEADGTMLRSLWVVAHRGLRRAGLRAHADSAAVLVAWRGEGIVQVRPPGGRRSVTLAPRGAAAAPDAVDSIAIAAGTPYDTLADTGGWIVLAFHAHPGPGLVRQQWQTSLEGETCVEQSEEDPS